MKKPLIALTIGLVLAGCGNAEIVSETPEAEEVTVPIEDKLIGSETSNNQDELNSEDDQQKQQQPVEGTSVQHESKQVDSKDDTSENAIINDEAITVIANPSDLLVLVNKMNSLPANYVPSNLVAPNVPFYFSGDDPKRYLRPEAAVALEQLFEAASTESIEILGASGYRSYSRQESIFASNVKRQGEEAARRVSAVAGQSEHQTGLAIDLTSAKVGFDLIEEFGETKEGIWLRENAHHFGFIIRYPKGKEHITGYSYEPWHIRFVGKEIAADVFSTDLTLEEYFSSYPVNSSGQSS